MIEVATRNILAADSGVSAIVNDVAGQPARIWFALRPQDERRPGIVLSLISAVPAFIMSGNGGYVTGRMQLTCLAPDYPTAKTLAAAARKAIEGFSGSSDETNVAWVETENMRDVPAVPLQGAGGPGSFGVSIDANFLLLE